MTNQTDQEMRALRLHVAGDPASLRLERLPIPKPRDGELLVRVHAAAITRGELDWASDRLPATPSYELSGVAVDSGEEVVALTPFDRDGVAADYAVVAANLTAPKPRTLSHAEAAALPMPALTAWQGLFDHGRLQAGERVLIHGAAGAVGAVAVQLARRHGAYVLATTSPDRVDAVRAMGADEAIDATSFEDVAGLVDVVFDTAGGERLRRSPGVLRPGGRLVTIVEDPPPGGVYFVVEPDGDRLRQLVQLADTGVLRLQPAATVALERAGDAIARSQAAGRHGKLVIEID